MSYIFICHIKKNSSLRGRRLEDFWAEHKSRDRRSLSIQLTKNRDFMNRQFLPCFSNFRAENWQVRRYDASNRLRPFRYRYRIPVSVTITVSGTVKVLNGT